MCKVTRNPRSAHLSRRLDNDYHSQANEALCQEQQHHKLIIRTKHKHVADKLTELPSHNHNTEVQERTVDKDKNNEVCSNVNVIRGNANMSASLRAISALCLRKPPNIIPGAIIRECLLGQVSRGTFVSENNECAAVVVKEFNLTQVLNKTTKNGRGLHEDALVELQIHTYIQSKRIRNVIGLYGMHLNEQSNKLYAYLEYAGKGELFSIVQERGMGGLPLEVCGNYFVQLLQGIVDLHFSNVVHRDLSLENVLVTEADEIKICDFGLATICAPGVTINDGRVIGKVNYMCPELYYGEQYDPRKVDIWSAAVIFFLMLTGVFPYERPSVEDARLVMLCNGRINELLTHWKRPTLDEELLQVFSKMFCPPQQRWNAQQLLQLPFCQRFANVSKAAKTADNATDDSNGMSRHREAASQVQASTPSQCASTISMPRSNSSQSMDSAISLARDTQCPSSPDSASPALSFAASSSVASPSPSYTRHKFFLSSESDYACDHCANALVA